MKARRALTLLPAFLFLTLALFFIGRLALIWHGDLPDIIPSAMIGKPAPDFSLFPLLDDGKLGFASEDLKGKITLVNVFASWCVPCRAEHPLLFEVKKAGIYLAGIDYKDNPADTLSWLDKDGNPYDTIGADRDGHTAIDFGVYGVPESYLIDRHGIIRFKQTGPLTEAIIHDRILPLAEELSK